MKLLSIAASEDAKQYFSTKRSIVDAYTDADFTDVAAVVITDEDQASVL